MYNKNCYNYTLKEKPMSLFEVLKKERLIIGALYDDADTYLRAIEIITVIKKANALLKTNAGYNNIDVFDFNIDDNGNPLLSYREFNNDKDMLSTLNKGAAYYYDNVSNTTKAFIVPTDNELLLSLKSYLERMVSAGVYEKISGFD